MTESGIYVVNPTTSVTTATSTSDIPHVKEKSGEEGAREFLKNFEEFAIPKQGFWYERLDRILQPEKYAVYDKTKKEYEANNRGFLANFLISFGESITKPMKEWKEGKLGLQMARKGLDYNDRKIELLAVYKTELEASGGKLRFDASGEIYITLPPTNKKMLKPEKPAKDYNSEFEWEEAYYAASWEQNYGGKLQSNRQSTKKLLQDVKDRAKRNEYQEKWETFLQTKKGVTPKQIQQLRQSQFINPNALTEITGLNPEATYKQFYSRYPDLIQLDPYAQQKQLNKIVGINQLNFGYTTPAQIPSNRVALSKNTNSTKPTSVTTKTGVVTGKSTYKSK